MRPAVIDRSLVLCGSHSETGSVYALGNALVAIFTARAPDKDTVNEDSAAVVRVGDNRAVLMVADGVGGQPDGELASSIAMQVLRKALQAVDPKVADLRSTILSGIESAHARILNEGSGAATTLAAVELRDGLARPYHVGDSNVLVTGQRGKIKLETVSHSPVGYAVESGMLSEADAIHHEERHLVSNVLGAPDMHVSVGMPMRLTPRDSLLLATDGLFDNLHKEEIIERIRKGPLEVCAQSLARLARSRMQADGPLGKPDDMTFIIYRSATGRRSGRA